MKKKVKIIVGQTDYSNETALEKLKEFIQLTNQIKDKIDIQTKPIACQIIDL